MKKLCKVTIITALCATISAYGSEQLEGAVIIRDGITIDTLPTVAADFHEDGSPISIYLNLTGDEDCILAHNDQIQTKDNKKYKVVSTVLEQNANRVRVLLGASTIATRGKYIHHKDGGRRTSNRNY